MTITTVPVELDNKEKIIEVNPSYFIKVCAGENIVLIAGVDAKSKQADFTHPNLSGSEKTIHEFKHYRKNGSKFWTSKAGVDFYFVIPKSEIKIYPQEGYSYVYAVVNGVQVVLNVSGGGSNNWTDYVDSFCRISVGHGIKTLKKLAEVAVPEKLNLKTLDEYETKRWESNKAKNQELIEKIVALPSPTIKILDKFVFYRAKQGVLSGVSRRLKKVETVVDGKKSVSRDWVGAVKRLNVRSEGNLFTVKVGQVDWIETAKLNGIEI